MKICAILPLSSMLISVLLNSGHAEHLMGNGDCDDDPFTYCVDSGEGRGCKCYLCSDICPKYTSNGSSLTPQTAPSYECLQHCNAYVKLFEPCTHCNRQDHCKTLLQRIMDKSTADKVNLLILLVILVLLLRVYFLTQRMYALTQEVRKMYREQLEAGNEWRTIESKNHHILVPDSKKTPNTTGP